MTLSRLPFALLALLDVVASHAPGFAPRQALYPNGTITRGPISTPAPTNTREVSCDNDCTLADGLFVEILRYTQRQFDHTIKAADITLVINNRTNTTRTITNLIELPTGYTRPLVNDDGTAIWTVTTDYENDGTTILTFPTAWTLYDSSYAWEGVLATTAFNGLQTCETAVNFTTIDLPSHPQPGPITFPSDIESYTRSPLNITFPPDGDKKGIYYTTSWDQVREDEFYRSVFPGEEAFKTCLWPQLPLPALAQQTAYLLTETHTSYDDSAPTSTSSDDGGDDDGGGRGSGIRPHLAHTEATVPLDEDTTENGGVPATAQSGETKSDNVPGGLASTTPDVAGGTKTEGRGGEAQNTPVSGSNGGTSGGSSSNSGNGGSGDDNGSGNGGDENSGSGSSNNGGSSNNNNEGGSNNNNGSSGGSNDGGPGTEAQPGSTPTPGPQETAGSGSTGPPLTVTISGVVVTTDSSGHVIVSGTTLTPGSTIFVTPSTGGSAVPVAIQTEGASGSAQINGQGGGGTDNGEPQDSGPSGSDSGSDDGGRSGSGGDQGSDTGSSGSGSQTPGSGGTDNTALVVGDTTTTLAPPSGSTGSDSESGSPPIVVAGTTYYPTATAIGATSAVYIINGQTLAPGHAITLGTGSSITVVALTENAVGQSVLVVGGSTSVLPTSVVDTGAYIISGLAGPVASSVASAEAASGSATITEAVLTLSGTAGGGTQTVTAIEIAPGTWIVPDAKGGSPTTISAGGVPITLSNGEILSAASNGVVVGDDGSSTTVAASATVVTATDGGGGVQQFTGDASTPLLFWPWNVGLAAGVAVLFTL